MANENTRVCVTASHNAVELAQNSINLPCGQEYDLFISPNGIKHSTFLFLNFIFQVTMEDLHQIGTLKCLP